MSADALFGIPPPPSATDILPQRRVPACGSQYSYEENEMDDGAYDNELSEANEEGEEEENEEQEGKVILDFE